ncbi:hypothetical protein [Kitasatospora aureofaciens]|uniref:hypothetical protein n=1 Tax=Kitasatospora aureofaciens TaxID=1894 RepID=UPI001C49560F|nr:hypothetical protein [Kitasatospora aureofaciens]MBV6697835.1 hypothetical protein [Kitasatospora aureofaciens]
MVFNIGSQQAGAINNVAGNQSIHGGQSGRFTVGAQELSGLVGDLRTAVEAEPLPESVAPQVRAELDAMEREADRPEPDKAAVADRLSRVTRLLGATGAALKVGTGLFGAVSALAGWLGSAGQPILHAIGL